MLHQHQSSCLISDKTHRFRIYQYFIRISPYFRQPGKTRSKIEILIDGLLVSPHDSWIFFLKFNSQEHCFLSGAENGIHLLIFFLLKVVTFFEMTTIVQIKGKPTHVTCCTKQDFCHPIMCCTSLINVQVSKHIRKEVR